MRKLSEIKGEETFDVIADLVEPCANVASDENVKTLFKKQACPEGMTPEDFMLQRIKAAVPGLMKTHKDDLVTIFSCLEGVTKEEYLEVLTLPKLIGDVFGMVTDKELLAFLS